MTPRGAYGFESDWQEVRGNRAVFAVDVSREPLFQLIDNPTAILSVPSVAQKKRMDELDVAPASSLRDRGGS